MMLTKLETAWAEAAMGAIFPGSPSDGLVDIRAMDVRGFLSQIMRTVPFQAALGFRVAVWIVALAPFFVIARFATITGLDAAARERVIDGLLSSRSYAVRSLVLVVKTMGALLYAGDDGVRARMNTPAATGLVALRRKRTQSA